MRGIQGVLQPFYPPLSSLGIYFIIDAHENRYKCDRRRFKIRQSDDVSCRHLGAYRDFLEEGGGAGAGAVVTKSISKEETIGYPNPTVIEHIEGNAIINAIDLSNPGCEEFAREVAIAKEGGKPVIVSVYGKTVEEFVEV
ncbi:MAG: hypothetical protein ACXQTS_03380, partial [Candidatus Methanospirareceae archaeon]